MYRATLLLSDIRIDGGTQSRAEMNQAVVDEYAEHLDSLPPPEVYNDGDNLWLGDGFYRYHAHVKAGRKEIVCHVHKGTLDDAKWHAAGANKTHGLRRTNEDKANAVRMALSLSGAITKTDRELGDHCGVAPNTVAKYRAELAPVVSSSGNDDGNAQFEHSPSETRTRRDGATISVSSAKRSEAAKSAAATAKETTLSKLIAPVREAWDNEELTLGQAKKLAAMDNIDQRQELKRIREAAEKKAAKPKPKIEEPADDEENAPDDTIEDIMERQNTTIESFCRKVMKFVSEEFPDDPWMDHHGRKDSAIQKFKDACAVVRQGKCAGLCPKCETGCRKCHNTGRMPRFELDQLGAAK